MAQLPPFCFSAPGPPSPFLPPPAWTAADVCVAETQPRGQRLLDVQLVFVNAEHLFCFGSGSLLAVVDVFVSYTNNTTEAISGIAVPGSTVADPLV